MREEIATTSDTGLSSTRLKARRFILWLFVVLFILFEWHLIPLEWLEHDGRLRPIITSILVVLSGGVVELLFDTRRAVGRLSKEFKAVSSGFSTPLRPLRECTRDLHEKLDAIKPGERVLIDHFGLDMQHAWDFVKRDILSHPKLKDVEIRILMLTDDSKKLGAVPVEVRHWCSNVPNSLAAIKTSLENEELAISREQKRLKIEVKQYCVLPTIHGFSVSQPIKIRYISFCRWKGQEYIWGEDSYRTIGDTTDPTLNNEADIFEGNFEYLWSTGAPVLSISYPKVSAR
jgi:hypothetical protein